MLAACSALVLMLSMEVLVLVQDGAAAAAGMLWTLDHPGRGLLSYPALGALCGVLVTPGLLLLRRLVAPRCSPLAFCCGVLCLGVYAGRGAASVALRARQGFPGGRVAALLIFAALVGLLGLAAAWMLQRRVARAGVTRPLAVVRDAVVLGLGPLVLVLGVHLEWLSLKSQALQAGLLGAPALALIAVAGVLGLIWGALLLPPVQSRSCPGELARDSRPAPGARSRWQGAGSGRGTPPGWWLRGLARVALLVLVGLGLWALYPVGQAPPASPAAERSGPNVLLVVLDTLRRDAVSAYGLVADSTPRLDELAAHGLLFDDALSNGSWTVPSHASLFTGAEVSRHGCDHLRETLRERPAGPRTARLPTLAERLAGCGWHTAAFVCNMNLNRATGFDRGFAEWREPWRARQGDYDVLAPALAAWAGGGRLDKGGELATRGVVDWLARHAHEASPWFLFVNMMEAHAPYGQAPQRFARAFLHEREPSAPARALMADSMAHVLRGGLSPERARELWRVYLGGVRYQDWLLGRVLDQLEQCGLTDDTLVLVTSDHGEHFGWQGLLGHGQDLSDDLLRIPLVLAGPGLPQGVLSHDPASLIDIAPTLLSLCGLPAPAPVAGCDGLVLAGEARAAPSRLSGRARVVERLPWFRESVADYARLAREMDPAGGELRWAWGRAGVYLGDAKLVRVDGPLEPPRRLSLLRREALAAPLDDGRRELDDAPRREELERALDQALASWPRALEASGTGPPAWSPDDLERLRELGYLGELGDGTTASDVHAGADVHTGSDAPDGDNANNGGSESPGSDGR